MIENLLSRLDKVKQVGQGRYVACCPAHSDSDPSLSITLAESGKILMYCHAGCATYDVVSAIGLTLGDLMGENPNDQWSGPVAHRDRPNYVPLYKGIDMDSYYRTVLDLAEHDVMKGIQSSPQDMKVIQQAMNYFNSSKGVKKVSNDKHKSNTIKALRVEYRRFLGL